MKLIRQLKFDEKGLIPAVVQDAKDGTVLMVAYMNREAVRRTLRLKKERVLEPVATIVIGSKAKAPATYRKSKNCASIATAIACWLKWSRSAARPATRASGRASTGKRSPADA